MLTINVTSFSNNISVIDSYYQHIYIFYFCLLYLYIFLNYAAVPPRILNSSRDITVEMSAEVQLECFAAGIPTPSITWFRYTHTGQRNG